MVTRLLVSTSPISLRFRDSLVTRSFLVSANRPLGRPWRRFDPGALLEGRFPQLGLRGALGFEQGGIGLLQEGVQLQPLAAVRSGHAKIGK